MYADMAVPFFSDEPNLRFLKPILKVRVFFKTYVLTNSLHLTINLCFIINHGNGDWYWGLY